MKKLQPLLLSFLNLEAGLLDNTSSSQLRSLIVNDRETAFKWKSFQRATSNRWQDHGKTGDINGAPVVSPQWLAAFLENQLDTNRQEQFETTCWQHPRLLQTVVEVFQLQQSPVHSSAPDAALTDRLLRLGGVQSPDQVSAPTESVPAINLQADTVYQSVRARKSRRQIDVRAWIAVAAISGVALAVATILIWRTAIDSSQSIAVSPGENSIVIDQNSIVADDSPAPKKNNKEEDNPDAVRPRLANTPDATDQPLEPDSPDPDVAPSPNQIANSPAIENPGEPRRDGLPDQPSELPKYVPAPALAMAWKDTEGLVAMRNAGQDKWSGYAAHAFVPADGITTFVLPGSLGKINFDSLGTLMMAPNTRATWHVNVAKGIVEVELGQGGLLLAGAPVGTQLRIDDGLKKWSIAISEPKTEIGIDGETGLDEAGSRLFVNDGSVLVDGTEIKRHQQVVWISEQRNALSRFSVAPGWARGKRDSSFVIPNDVVKTLATSDDLSRDFNSILASDDLAHHDVARFCLASIEPETFERTYLANVDPRIRQQGILWLMQFQQSQPEVRQMAQRFARTWQAPEIGRVLPRAIYALQSGRTPSYADAEQLVAGLMHSELEVRQLASDLLVRFFGAKVPYQADAQPSLRERSANAWTRLIEENYGRPDNRRRGQ